MEAAREMARRIKRQQERALAERRKAIKELGIVSIIFLVIGSTVATAGYATDNVYGALFGGVVMLAGMVFGILWAVSDDR
jgi:hypothetical protein